MVLPVVGGNESKGYDVENSLRFNSGDSARLTEDFSSASRQTFTFSTWFKRGKLSTTMSLLSSGTSNSERTSLFINSDDTVRFFSSESDSVAKLLKSNALLRDPSAWYHLVLRYDSTQSTNTDRIRFYLNGSEMTYQSSPTYPAQNNSSIYIGSDDTHGVGCLFYGSTATEFFDGYMAETHYIDGTSYDHTQFGEFDNNGVWIPKKYTGSYGTNGFYLEFKQTGTSANSSGIGADTSGNDNHFTPTNLAALDVTEDTCTNNFATFSPLGRVTGTVTLSEGNCKIEGSSDANASGQHGTIAFTAGKWYLEMKATDSTTTQLGFLTVNSSARGDNTPDVNGGMNYHYANIYYQYNNSSVNKVDTGGGGISAASVSGGSNSSLGGFSDGDILMFALDMDNNRAYFGKNGTWFNSGNPANGTNYFSLQTDVADGVTFYAGVDANTGTELNTGNPSFSISSGNNDGKYGNFEYEVPSGYYAMCTKRLAEFG